MKTLIKLMCAAMLFLSVGCASRSVERNAVSVVQSVTLTIEAAEDLWGSHVVLGNATSDQIQRVELAHARYLIARQGAILAVQTAKDPEADLQAYANAASAFIAVVKEVVR